MATKKSLSSLKTTINLNGKNEIKEENSESKEVKPVNSLSYGSEPFTPQDLEYYWNTYLEKLKTAGRITEQMIMQGDFDLEGKKITLLVGNDIQLEKLTTFKEELMVYLRSSLKNGDIMLEASVNEKKKEQMIYTSIEKFKHLAKRHPNLEKFKTEFGLETGF